jgi:hypothetical protein
MTLTPRGTPFDDDLLDRIRQVVEPGDELKTLRYQRPNKITSIEPEGIWVLTTRSAQSGAGPQLVPAWMITRAWNELSSHRQLSQQRLLNGLNVKRSAFVCALLAMFPEVAADSADPTLLKLDP